MRMAKIRGEAKSKFKGPSEIKKHLLDNQQPRLTFTTTLIKNYAKKGYKFHTLGYYLKKNKWQENM